MDASSISSSPNVPNKSLNRCGTLFDNRPGVERFHPLEENKVIHIGRDPIANDIVLPHTAVSSSHCLIWAIRFDEKTLPVCYVKDVSLNGVYLNGELVGKHRVKVLQDNDLVEIKYGGKFLFTETMRGEIGISEPPDVSNTEWEITDRLLGYGTFGRVYIAKNRNVPDKLYAVKVIKNRGNGVSGQRDKESAILQNMCHPNIVSIHETLDHCGCTLIFQDLISGGDLHSYLTRDGFFKSISETESKLIVYQLLSALSYLHSLNVIHRDLKLDNVLLETPQRFSRVLLSDFGAAKLMPSARTYTVIGTAEYCAPEVGLKSMVATTGYGKPCDMWSLGVILHIMLFAQTPFSKEGMRDLGEGVSLEAKKFIMQLLDRNYYKRLTVEQCFEDGWIKKHREMLETSYKLILNRSDL